MPDDFGSLAPINNDNAVDALRNTSNQQTRQLLDLTQTAPDLFTNREDTIKRENESFMGALTGANNQVNDAFSNMKDAMQKIQHIDQYPFSEIFGLFGNPDYNKQVQRDRMLAGKLMIDDAVNKRSEAATLYQNAVSMASRPIETLKEKAGILQSTTAATENAMRTNIAANAEQLAAQQRQVERAPIQQLKAWAQMDKPPVPLGLIQTEINRKDMNSLYAQSAAVALEAGKTDLYQKHLQNWLSTVGLDQVNQLVEQAQKSPNGLAQVTDPGTGVAFGTLPLRTLQAKQFDLKEQQRKMSEAYISQAQDIAKAQSSKDSGDRTLGGVQQLNGGIIPPVMRATDQQHQAAIDVALRSGDPIMVAKAYAERDAALSKSFDDFIKEDDKSTQAAKRHLVDNFDQDRGTTQFTDNQLASGFLFNQGRNPVITGSSVYANELQGFANNLYSAQNLINLSGQNIRGTDNIENLLQTGQIDPVRTVFKATTNPLPGTNTLPAAAFQNRFYKLYVNETLRNLVIGPDGRPLVDSPFRKYVDQNGNLLDKYYNAPNQLIGQIARDDAIRNTGQSTNVSAADNLIALLRNSANQAAVTSKIRQRYTPLDIAAEKVFMNNEPHRFIESYIQSNPQDKTGLVDAAAEGRAIGDRSVSNAEYAATHFSPVIKKALETQAKGDPNIYGKLIEDYRNVIGGSVGTNPGQSSSITPILPQRTVPTVDMTQRRRQREAEYGR